MDAASDIREFLSSRRARLTPTDVGLPDYGGRRRVSGLRREEVALLAGMSVEYYTRLERGNASGVSDTILDGISRALRLSAAERAHLRDLVRTAAETTRLRPRPAAPTARRVQPSTQRLLDMMIGVPAIVQNGRLDVIASNALGRALFSTPGNPALEHFNFARFLFLEPAGRTMYRDWDDSAAQLVALLRAETGRTPNDPELGTLLADLQTGSSEFRALWSAHDVHVHLGGLKRFQHPGIGDIELTYETMLLAVDTGLQFVAFTAAAGSPAENALHLLASDALPALERLGH